VQTKIGRYRKIFKDWKNQKPTKTKNGSNKGVKEFGEPAGPGGSF